MKEINLLPPRASEVLTGVKTNKFGDITCAKYKSVTPRSTIDGVCATLDQIKVVPPNEKKPNASKNYGILVKKDLEDTRELTGHERD